MEWVPVQLFMAVNGDEPRTFVVSFRPVLRELSCSCPGWQLRNRCRHVKYVQQRIDSEGGYSPPYASRQALAALTDDVKKDPEKFRQWLYTNTGVLMLASDGTLITLEEFNV